MQSVVSPIRSVYDALRQRAARAVVILAIAMQALLPGGYMLAASPDDGSIAITLCSSAGIISAFMGADGQITEAQPGSHKPDSDGDDKKPLCGFVGHSTGAFTPNQVALSLLNQNFEVVAKNTPKSLMLVPGLGLAAPPPPKTGPPTQV